MLNIYLKTEPDHLSVCYYNDFWFDRKFNEGNIKISQQHIDIIRKIDNVQYDERAGRIKSKFIPDCYIDITELSSGCKTALNVFSFPEHCFYIGECGKNALQEIFNFSKGNIYVKNFVVPPMIQRQVKIDDNTIIDNSEDLLEVFRNAFEGQ